jgi:uncharacterized membrane protein YccC
VDWSQFEGAAALRCTIGVAVPLIGGLVVGRRLAGVFGAVGALSVGFGSFQGVYRSRATVMIAAACGMAVSIFVGSLAGSTAGAMALAAVWGFGSGILVSLGASASFVGLQSGVAALVATGFPSDVETAAGRLLAVLAGGAIQTLLVVALWVFPRFRAERRALAAVFESLATYAARIPHGSLVSPEPQSLAEAQPAFRDPQPFAKVWQTLALRSLLDEAERIRAVLAALALHRARRTDEALEVERLARFADLVSDILREIGRALEEARDPSASAPWPALESAARDLAQDRALVDTLLGQVRAAWRIAGVMTGASADTTVAPSRIRPLRSLPPIGDALHTLGANLTLDSTAFRHAIRLAVVLTLSTALYRVASIPRGYWVPMTALLVLKPEFQGTFATGVGRVAGTLVGAVGATALTVALVPGPLTLILLVLGFVWCGYSLFRTNYAIFAMCMTGYVVFLLTLAGTPERAAATYRTVNTALGGCLALLVYAAWPTWEGSHVRDRVADLLDAHRRYVTALFRGLIDRSSMDRARLGAGRAAARLARSNAEASVQRMLVEPFSRRSLDADVALGLLAATRRHALAVLALQARLEREANVSPEFERLAGQIEDALRTLARALRERSLPSAMPPLRATQEQLRAVSTSTVLDETDVMVDSLNTMADLLRR